MPWGLKDLAGPLGQGLLTGLGRPQQGRRDGSGTTGAEVDAGLEDARLAKAAQSAFGCPKDLRGFGCG